MCQADSALKEATASREHPESEPNPSSLIREARVCADQIWTKAPGESYLYGSVGWV